jgi:uncharacterized membrane protein YeaQ/YmgE (transglycosylase-associated protein family)
MAVMSILAWIVLGLISGFVASLIVKRRGMGMVLDVAIGLVGAVAGGFLFSLFGRTGVTGFNLWSIGVSVAGALVLLFLVEGIRRVAGGGVHQHAV